MIDHPKTHYRIASRMVDDLTYGAPGRITYEPRWWRPFTNRRHRRVRDEQLKLAAIRATLATYTGEVVE